MKKITLLFSAMLFSLMSFAGVVTFDADTDKGNAGTDSNNAAAYTITKDGVTVTVSSGILGTYNNQTHYRIYKNQTLTVTSTVGAITSVEFTCTANDDVKYGPGCFTWSTGNYTYSGAKGTWSGSAAEVVFTASSNQVRATEIVVAIDGETNPGEGNGGGSNDNDTTGTVPPADGVITCAEAVAICQATGETATTESYTIRGYVTSIATAYNASFNNTSFWMADTQNGGNVFEAFRSKPLAEADKTVKVGDYVEVTGKLVNYKGDTPETEAGGTYTILVAGEGGSTPVEPEKPEAKPLTDGYTKVTNISELANDDKVVLYCDAYAVGVAGFDGVKSGLMAETGWVEYVVELVEGGLKLKDANQYIALTEKNTFRYKDEGSVLNVTENAMLSSVFEEKTYLLYRNANTKNNNPLCRMYVDKSGDSEYAPFYVYKVTTTTAVEDVTVVEMPVKVIQNGQVLIKCGENVYNIVGVHVK